MSDFHLAGFTQSQDSAVLVQTLALADQSLQVNTNDIIVPDDMTMLLGAYAVGLNATRAQIISPSIRRQFGNEILPLDLSLTPTDQLLMEWYGDNALQLDNGEQLNGMMAEGGAGATRVTILAWLGRVPPTAQNGDIRTIRITSTTAAVANVWSNITPVFNDVLPAGTYACVGAMLQSTNMQAFRLVPKGASYRPGAIGITANSQRHNPIFRHGGLGTWCTFQNLTPPTIDVLCNGADASFAGVMDLVFLGN